MKRMLVAIGGNALLKKGEKPDFKTHLKNANDTAGKIMDILAGTNMELVLTHGNGPQVGDEFIRNERAKKYMPKLPLHILTAETQAYIGAIISNSLNPMLREAGKGNSAVIITNAIVSGTDPAIKKPTKQIGPYYTKEQLMRELKLERFDYVKEKNSYRMVVPSPKPIRIIEIDAIKSMLSAGFLTICGGGGGIPVVKKGNSYVGINAVIDKDATSALIAENIGASELVILTDTDYLYSDFDDQNSRIRSITAKDSSKLLPKLEAGTIRPKLEACMEFVLKTGKPARIGALENAYEVARGKSGTVITP
ncbi:MAG: carbamate kinase [Candidatus Marsarchaeota archaeon]|nr:carbamate kinase [Candidatus Marsarchaeota archaeon]